MILLNDDEIKIILHGGVEKAVIISTPTRDIAKAQLKKVLTLVENVEDDPAYYYETLGKIATLGDLREAILEEIVRE